MADLRDMETVRQALQQAGEPVAVAWLMASCGLTLARIYAALVTLYDMGAARILIGLNSGPRPRRKCNLWEIVP